VSVSLVTILNAATELLLLSLHDALPISDSFRRSGGGAGRRRGHFRQGSRQQVQAPDQFVLADVEGRQDPDYRIADGVDQQAPLPDRKSTRLNSSHVKISYAVFCLKKKMN